MNDPIQVGDLPREPNTLILRDEDLMRIVTAPKWLIEKMSRSYAGFFDHTESRPKDAVDKILYWDEMRGMIYVEAIACYTNPLAFARFRKYISTEIDVKGTKCKWDGGTKWVVRKFKATTEYDRRGRLWNCFSIVFVCKSCLDAGYVSERQVAVQSFKVIMSKLGIGIKEFLGRIERIKIIADLKGVTAEADIELGPKKTAKLKRCPLIG